jgi:hypothetical protein
LGWEFLTTDLTEYDHRRLLFLLFLRSHPTLVAITTDNSSTNKEEWFLWFLYLRFLQPPEECR